MSPHHASITSVINISDVAARSGDGATFASVFTPSGVFMANHFPAAKGHAAIQVVVEQMSSRAEYKGRLEIIKIEDIATDWAVVEIEGTGFVKVVESGKEVDVKNKGIILMHHIGGEWKATHAVTSSSLPPPFM